MLKTERHGILYRLFVFSGVMGLLTVSYHLGQDYRSGQNLQPLNAAILLNHRQSITSFEGVDAEGRAFVRNDLLGRWNLLALDLAQSAASSSVPSILVRIHNRLASRPQLQENLRLLLLLKATDTDDSVKIREPIRELYGSIISIITLEHPQFSQLEQTIGMDRREINSKTQAPNAFFLVDPDGILVALFTTNTDTASIGQDIVNIVDGRYRRNFTNP